MFNSKQSATHYRHFTSFIILIVLMLGCTPSDTHITILHTNDTHSQILPLPEKHHRYPNLGGYARRATVIEQVRATHKNVLLFDCGDFFQGTPYFNLYKGKLEIDLMNTLKYDAATIGNHEFDNGIEALAQQAQRANFPLISSNYDFSETPMGKLTLPYKVFEIEDIKIGVFGLGIELNGLVNATAFANTKYLDPIETANKTSELLKRTKGCNYVICLSHLGFEYSSESVSDKVIAQNSKYIDLILGGHTHTLLEKPIEVMNTEGDPVIINQVGYAGAYVGQLHLTFSKNSKKPVLTSQLIHVE